MSRDERAERSGAREPDEGPSARWAALLAVVALLPAPGVLLGVLRSLPEQGWQEGVVPLLLIASWLAGAYSLARVLQLTVHALTRPAASRDRKSTRLNSSHVAISYAVLCLKRKTDAQPA